MGITSFSRLTRYNNIVSIWYKALIVLIWLAVPVAGSLLVQNSYQQYLIACSIQRQDCRDRGDFLSSYADTYSKLASQADRIADQAGHRSWIQDFQAVEQRELSAAGVLRQQEPIHFPTADVELGGLETQLREMKSSAKEAGYYRLDYINAGKRQENLLAAKLDLEKTSYYYKQIGMEGIYLQLQEDLARVEDDVRAIRKQRRRYYDMVGDSLSDAKSSHKLIQQGLGNLQDKIDSDEDQTYRQELHLRLMEFNLLKELKTIVFGKGQNP